MAEAVAARHHRRAPPRRAGRDRHRQVARLPRPGDPRRAAGAWSPPPPRRCRTSWSARTCRSSPSTSARTFATRCSRAGRTTCASSGSAEVGQGADQLALDGLAAPCARPRSCAASRAWSDQLTDRRPRRARLRAVPDRRGRRSACRPRSAPARPAAPRATCASPSGPAGGRRGRRSWSSTPTSTGRTSQSGGVILPEHDVVVIDEAHQLEDIDLGHRRLELGGVAGSPAWPGRCGRSSTTRTWSTRSRRAAPTSPRALRRHVGRRLKRRARAGDRRRPRRSRPSGSSGCGPRSAGSTTRGRRRRGPQAAGHEAHRRAHRRPRLRARAAPAGVGDLGRGPDHVAESCGWRPIDVAGDLQATLWSTRTPRCSPARPSPPSLPCGSGSTARRHGVESALRPARRRQPVRLRGQRPPLLRRPPARPPRRPATRRRCTTSSRR